MCRHNVPSFSSSNVPVTTAHGVGKITLCVATTVIHHAAINAAMTAKEGKVSFTWFIVGIVAASYQNRCNSSRVRHRIRAQGVSGFGSTMIVIWPLACAVQAN
jgi:hypothetical protein